MEGSDVLLAISEIAIAFALHHLGTDHETIWAISSAIMAVFLVVHMMVVAPKLRRLARQDSWTTRRFEPLIGILIVSTLSVQSLNALRIGPGRGFGAYLLGLILFLGLAAMHFVALMAAVGSTHRDP